MASILFSIYSTKDLDELKKDLGRAKSDYAAQLLRLDEINTALPILEQLYAEYPQEYNIVANLGTAYELAGQDSKALYLLHKGVFINPNSHRGSEWIHLKILEAKIGLKANPLWLQQNPILGFDFGKDTLPKKK